jgi:hypothetical protein
MRAMRRKAKHQQPMIHYHGTPITPIAALYELSGRCFCVSHAAPGDVSRCHQIGQSVMLDNGAFSKWKTGKATNWASFYAWCDPWLSFPTTWAVIPDVIGAGPETQEALLKEWPHGEKGAPVWHMDEPVSRILALCDEWPRVCVGSSDDPPMSDAWQRKIDEAWNAIAGRHRFLPWVHMLRGMQLSGRHWPFASVDSTDVARNHHRAHQHPAKMAARWDKMQCPGKWEQSPEQLRMA